MAASITPKFQRYNQAKFLDGTAVTPLEYIVTQWEGAFNYSEPEPDALSAYNGNEFSAVVKGQVQPVPLSITVNFTQFTVTEVGSAEILDFLKKRGDYALAESTAPATFTNFFMFDVELTVPGTIFGEQADAVKVFHRTQYVTHSWANGDPNTMQIDLMCYGGVTETGSTPV